MKKLRIPSVLLIALIGVSILTTACKKEGCTDPLATNYNEKANHDDGSCEYDGVTPGSTLVVTENIDLPTTWNYARVEICGDIEVNAALTISAGANVVMCAGASIDVEPSGSITAVGTATSPIVFKGEVASPGYWEGLSIQSNNPNNRLEYVTISDAGSYWGWDYANLYLNGAGRLVLKNSTFANSQAVGLFAADGTTITEFTNNTFSGNTTVGLSVEAQHVASLDEASNYNDANGEAYINVRSGAINTNQIWKRTTTPLLLLSTVEVNAGLTINAGSTVLFEAGEGMDIADSGWLFAVGTASMPINFKGRFATPGYWAGIRIQSNNPNNKIAYANITDGGSYWAWEYSGLVLDGRLELDNSTISNSNSWGAYVYGSSTMICGGATQTDAAGVMTYNTITGNGVGADADCLDGGCTVHFD
jgi:hypothetical protein